MKHLQAVFALLVLFYPLSLAAGENIGGGIEALYWKPSTCSHDFARRVEGTRTQQFSIQPDFDWGLRAFGTYECNCWFTAVSYLRLEASGTKRATRGAAARLWLSGLVSAGYTEGTARLRFDYQNIDVRVCRPLLSAKCFRLSMSGNARWIDIERKSTVRGTGVDLAGAGTLNQNSDTQAGGAGLGLQGYSTVCWVDTFVSVDVMQFIGTAKVTRFRRTQINGIHDRLNFGGGTAPIPALDFRIGLSKSTNLANVCLSFELGFESHYYWNAMRYALPTQITQPLQEEEVVCRDVGFCGPYFGIRGQF